MKRRSWARARRLCRPIWPRQRSLRGLRGGVGIAKGSAEYQIHFKCSLRKLIEYEHLWPYTRDLYQWPGVAETVSFDEIRHHYYLTHPMINPSGLVAVRPAAGFDKPHGRESLG
jgi:glutathionyl-hydroquinone reductase